MSTNSNSNSNSNQQNPTSQHSSNQLPQQAGRFKPRKASAIPSSSSGRGNTSIGDSSVNDHHSSSQSVLRSQGSLPTNDNTSRNSKAVVASSLRSRQRGGNREGTNLAPKGQVFFTGAPPMTKATRANSTSNAHAYTNAHGHAHSNHISHIQENASPTDTRVLTATTNNAGIAKANSIPGVMPGLGALTATVGITAQDRLLASAMARRGEGEEIIVGTLEYDPDHDYDGDENHSNHDILQNQEGASKEYRRKSMDNRDHHDDYYDSHAEKDPNHYVEYDYTYDSDSSQDHDHTLSLSKSGLHPQQLPFPPPRRMGTSIHEPLYACQQEHYDPNEIKVRPKVASIQDHSIYNDAPLKPPFVKLNHPDDQKEELSSWMLFKFPTRLPRLAPHCIQSNASHARSKSTDFANHGIQGSNVPDSLAEAHRHYIQDPEILAVSESVTTLNPLDPSSSSPFMMIPDVIQSSQYEESKDMLHGATSRVSSFGSNSQNLYDDTLKDTSGGRYGKIVVHKSGKAYLVVGGADSKTPQVKMLLQNGLSCGFLQQAVSIRTKKEEDHGSHHHDGNNHGQHQGSFIPLGEVHRTIVVTPDVETAFL